MTLERIAHLEPPSQQLLVRVIAALSGILLLALFLTETVALGHKVLLDAFVLNASA